MTLVVDTSAILSVYLGESTADAISAHLNACDQLLMSTVNLAEVLIVLQLRLPHDHQRLSQRLLTSNVQFVAPTTDQTLLVAQARSQYPLNFGDCFAYALAKSLSLPLLTLDADFHKTDLTIVGP